jgi:type I restriction enzyme S subunit
MKSNYKPIGKYINLVEERNKELQDLPLIGLSITKQFIPSIANTIGTDMSTYRTIYKNQFAYSAVTSRNGDKLTIALFKDLEKGLISQAYTPFEVTNTNELLPEYLMMWFSRPEFDRYARFKSHGSARELFSWEDLCESLMPIPSITKQKEIVKEYNVLVDRINLNNHLIQKLEETAQAIYKQWFVDFEFPDEEGKAYKSNGGEMEFNEELEKEIPKGWAQVRIKDFCSEMKSGGTPSRDNPDYWKSNDVPWLKTGEISNKILVEAEEYISYLGCKNSSAKLLPINTVLIAMYGEGKTKGQAGYLRFEASTNQACCAMLCESEERSSLLYYFLRANQLRIANMANGGAQPNLSKELIENIKFLKPSNTVISKAPFVKFINQCEALEKETIHLEKMKSLLLSKLATIEN